MSVESNYIMVRRVPSPLKKALRKQAKTNNRSMNNEVLHILGTAIEYSPDDEDKK